MHLGLERGVLVAHGLFQGDVVLFDGFVQPVRSPQGQPQVDVRFRHVGLFSYGRLVGRDGLVKLAGLAQAVGEVVVGLGEMGVDRDGLAELGHRVGIAAETLQRDAVVREELGLVRV